MARDTLLHIADAISHNAGRRPAHPALVERDGNVITYAAFEILMRRTANHLIAQGIKAGDIVGLSMPDTAAHLGLMFGLFRMGAILLPMDIRWTPEEKSRIAAFFGATAVIAESPVEGVRTLCIDDSWHDAVAVQGTDGNFPNNIDDPLWLSLSSGTTGIPKGPLVTHRQMVLRFLSQTVDLGFNEHDRNILATPLYFGGGRGFTISNLFFGATVVMHPPPYKAEELAKAVNTLGITTLFLVPTLFRRMLAIADGKSLLFPNLRMLISSGSILHGDEREAIKRDLCPYFVNLFSSTEGGGVALLAPNDPQEKAASVGRAAYRNEFQVVDENDAPLKAGTVGRIRQRAPWLPDGFYNNEEETKKAFRDGWYYTGDLGKVDDEGYLYVVGRVKDMIIRGGINIYPAEIEDLLCKHETVHDAAVVAWPSPELGEEVAAFVVAEGEADAEALIAYCRGALAPYKVPKAVFFIDDLPKSAQGKVLKNDLVESLPAQT